MLFPSQWLQPLGLRGHEEGTVSQGTRSTSPADEGPSSVSAGAARLSGVVCCSRSGMGVGVGVGEQSPVPSELGWAPRCRAGTDTIAGIWHLT